MLLSTGTFLDDSFIFNIVFLSLVHYNELKNDYYFSMGYMNKAGELRSFELRFDDAIEAQSCRKEVMNQIQKINNNERLR